MSSDQKLDRNRLVRKELPPMETSVAGIIVATCRSRDPTFPHRAPCAQIGVGRTAEVHGTRQTDGSVLATRVHAEDAPGNEHEGEASGTLSQLSGACPSLTFMVNGTRVSTNASTEFKDVSCSALANGNTVEAKGTARSDGSLLASRVERKGK